MVKNCLIYSILFFLSFLSYVAAYAQRDSTTVIIEADHHNFKAGYFVVSIGGETQKAAITSNRIIVVFPRKIIGPATIEVRYFPPLGLTGRRWSQHVELNGSGFVIYKLLQGGGGQARQWPAVTWKGSGGVLDVYMNGTIRGSTEFTRGVQPDKMHRFTWKRNASVICDTTMALPFDVKRTCSCDVKTKRVTVE